MKKSVIFALAIGSAVAFSTEAQAGRIGRSIGAAIEKVGHSITSAVKRTAGPALHAVQGFKNFATLHLNKMIDAGKALGGRVHEAIHHFTTGFAAGLPKLIQRALDSGKRVGQGLLQHVRTAVPGLIAKLRADILKRAQATLGSVRLPNLGGFVQHFEDVFHQGIDLASKIAKGTAKRVEGQFSNLLQGFKGKINAAGLNLRKLLPPIKR